jgi:hypothetical protein
LLDATIWPVAMGGCHLVRDTEAVIRAACIGIDTLQGIRFLETRWPAPSAPHTLDTR